MQLFMCNKGLMMNVGLAEIKKMTPEEIIEYYKTFEIPNFYK